MSRFFDVVDGMVVYNVSEKYVYNIFTKDLPQLDKSLAETVPQNVSVVSTKMWSYTGCLDDLVIKVGTKEYSVNKEVWLTVVNAYSTTRGQRIRFAEHDTLQSSLDRLRKDMLLLTAITNSYLFLLFIIIFQPFSPLFFLLFSFFSILRDPTNIFSIQHTKR